MKKTLIALSALLVSVSGSAGFYGSVGVGANPYSEINTKDSNGQSITVKNDMGYAYSISAGYELPVMRLRAELEYLNLSTSTKEDPSLDIRSNGTFGNVMWKLPIPLIAPYIGAGIGFMDLAGYDSNDSIYMEKGLAYQGIIGVEIVMPVIKTIGVEARYVRSESGSGDKDKMDNILLMVKARF